MYFPNTFCLENEQDRSEENHTTDAVLLLSFLFAVVLQKVLTADYALTALQSLRHGFAVPPPFTQGRLGCGATLPAKFKFVKLFCLFYHTAAVDTIDRNSPGRTICRD